MESLTQEHVACPYCGESIEVLIDPQEVGQQYIEDCQVCCQPISFVIQVDDKQDIVVDVMTQNDVF